MGVFDKKNQLVLSWEMSDYFSQTLNPERDAPKLALQLASPVPILTIAYSTSGRERAIHVYPTLQFLYSHFVVGTYITSQVQDVFNSFRGNPAKHYEDFFAAAKMIHRNHHKRSGSTPPVSGNELAVTVVENFIRQNPQYTLAALRPGIYVIGMKEQFNIHDLEHHPLRDHVQYVADEHGFILHDRTTDKSIDRFGPYGIEQYILMEVLSKQEVAQNVMEYYVKHQEILRRGLETYDEKQGKGFVCWRFLMNESVKLAAMQAANDGGSKRGSPSPVVDMAIDDDTGAKKQRSNGNGTTTVESSDDASEVANTLNKSLDLEAQQTM